MIKRNMDRKLIWNAISLMANQVRLSRFLGISSLNYISYSSGASNL